MIRIDSNFLARTGGLVESLGNTTVLCAIDREGTIASPIPSVDQMFFIGENGDPIVLDVALDRQAPQGVRFEEVDWAQYLKIMKPCGLNYLLSNNCGVLNGRKRNDAHFKYNHVSMLGSLSPYRETCLCQFGRAMGFSKESLDKYTKKLTIQSFVPKHASVSTLVEYRFEVPSISTHIFCDNSKDTIQAMSNGFVELVLESCTDYWDGENLVPLNANVNIFKL